MDIARRNRKASHRQSADIILAISLWLFLLPCFPVPARSASERIGVFDRVEKIDVDINNIPHYTDITNRGEVRYDPGAREYTLTGEQAPHPGATNTYGLFLSTAMEGSFQLDAFFSYDIQSNRVGVITGGLMVKDGKSNVYDIESAFHPSAMFNGVVTDACVLGRGLKVHSYGTFKTISLEDENQTVYFRLKRFASIQTFIAEWSYEGEKWYSAPPISLKVDSTIQAGIFFVIKDSESAPGQALVRDVLIAPIESSYGQREIIPQPDAPGVLTVKIDLFNESDREQPVQAREIVSSGWEAIQASNQGKITHQESDRFLGETINWTLNIPPGVTSLQYQIRPMNKKWESTVQFSGVVNLTPLFGPTHYSPDFNTKNEELKHWRFWSVEDGMKSSSTRYLSLDRQGNVYSYHDPNFIHSFDGYEFSSIPLDENMHGSVKIGRDGSVWFYEEITGHLYLWDQNSRRWDRIDKGEQNPIFTYDKTWSSMYVNSQPIIKYLFDPIDRQRILFITPRALTLFDGIQKRESILLESSQEDIGLFFHMIGSRDGGYWITGEKGIVKIQLIPEKDRFRVEKSVFDLSRRLMLNDFIFPLEAPNGYLYFVGFHIDSDEKSIVRQNGSEFRILYTSGNMIDPVAANEDGGFWISEWRLFNQIDVSYFHANQQTILPKNDRFSEFSFSDSANEPAGNFWFASMHGLSRYASPVWRVPIAVQDINQPVASITEDAEGRVWFLSTDVLTRLHDESWTSYPLPTSTYAIPNKTHSLISLPNGNLLAYARTIFSPLHLMEFDPLKEKFQWVKHPDQLGFDHIAPGRDGSVFMALWSGGLSCRIDRYREGEFKAETGSLDGLNSLGSKRTLGIQSIYETSEGDIWIGSNTEEPVQRFRNGQKLDFPAGQSYPGAAGLSFLEYEKGILWVGDNDSIYEFDGKQWRRIRYGLDAVRTLIKTKDGSIWAASMTGIHRYKDGIWTTNTTEDGLPTNAVLTLFEDRIGRIWLGTMNGLCLYDPDADRDPPQTYILDKKNPTEFTSTSEVRLYFSGLDKWKFTESHRLYFSYRLDDGLWSPYDTSSVAEFTGLRPGDYSFAVRCMDRNWNVDRTPATFSFRVLPVLIQNRKWFLPALVLVFSLITVLFLIAKRQRSQISSYAKNLENLVQIRTEELRKTEKHILSVSEREQQRIGQELHDGVVQDLAGMSFLGDLLVDTLQETAPNTAEQADRLISMLKRTRDEVRILAKGLAPVTIERDGLVSALQDLAKKIRQVYGIDCFVDCETDFTLPTQQIALNLYRIAQEALNNAAKHAQAKTIRARIRKEGNKLQLTVIDDGVGIPPAAQDREGMGIAIMTFRAERIGAAFSIGAPEEGGTQVSCELILEE